MIISGEVELFAALRRNAIPFLIIGGHAVNFHGYLRTTEDTDVVWLRSSDAEVALLQALTELDAKFIGDDIDASTGLERLYSVTLQFIQDSPSMMLHTRHGFLDLFDHLPGLATEDVAIAIKSSPAGADGLVYASLRLLRRMKQASGRAKDQLDLEQLGE